MCHLIYVKGEFSIHILMLELRSILFVETHNIMLPMQCYVLYDFISLPINFYDSNKQFNDQSYFQLFLFLLLFFIFIGYSVNSNS